MFENYFLNCYKVKRISISFDCFSEYNTGNEIADKQAKAEANKVLGAGIKWASTRETMSSGVLNNTGTDQPVHTRSLISAFVTRLMYHT